MNVQAAQHEFVRRIDRNRAILFKVAAAYCRNRSDREDLVQEIIAQMWRSYDRFDERSSFSTWMYRVAVNVAISFLRSETRARRHDVVADDALLEAIPAPHSSEADDRLSVLHDLVAGLDPLNRALMILYLDDRPYSEIAAILGITETNVGTKIGRIKQRFKRTVAGTNA
jgi:RNA polymerase sigma-70 factor (ECF subfamily)